VHWPGVENPGPFDFESNTLTTTPPSHPTKLEVGADIWRINVCTTLPDVRAHLTSHAKHKNTTPIHFKTALSIYGLIDYTYFKKISENSSSTF